MCCGNRLSDRFLWLVPTAFSVLMLVRAAGCVCVDYALTFTVRGRLLDGATQEPLASVGFGGRLLRSGEALLEESFEFASSNDDGSFSMTWLEGLYGTYTPYGIGEFLVRDRQPIPPDQVELLVRLADCEQRILLEVDEDTVVDFSFPGGVAEFKDPVLVPACE